ncbi:MAG: hypothetical protein IRZ11_02640 [Clostridia bacterium]|nr:hypothetical protein [Clostridia bacterium]
MKCPVCGDRLTGRIAQDQYFCRECCVEFGWRDGALAVWALDADGEPVPVAAPSAPREEVRRCAASGRA